MGCKKKAVIPIIFKKNSSTGVMRSPLYPEILIKEENQVRNFKSDEHVYKELKEDFLESPSRT